MADHTWNADGRCIYCWMWRDKAGAKKSCKLARKKPKPKKIKVIVEPAGEFAYDNYGPFGPGGE